MWKKIIFYLFVLLSIGGFSLQIIDLIKNGLTTDRLVVVSEFLLVVWFVLIWLFRRPLNRLLEAIRPLGVRFVLLGYFSTVVAETVYIFSKPIHRNLGIDLILVAPWYLLWMILWYRLLRRYDYSLREAFILGGFHGFVIEGVLSGALLGNPWLGLLMLPLFTILYGLFFIVPYLVTYPSFGSRTIVTLGKKIKLSFLPLAAIIPGALWILILVKLFSLQLH